MSIQSAVVLAAGEGRRLRPLTRNRPKPMLPAATRPIIEHVFDALLSAGVTDLHVVVGYKRQRVQNHFGPTYDGVSVTYHVQEKPLGSGHALLQAADGVGEEFLVVNGDQVVDPQLVQNVVDAHDGRSGDEQDETAATLCVVESERASRYGSVRLDGDRVVELVEQPLEGHYRLVNAGVYAFTDAIFETIRETPTVDGTTPLPDAIARLVESDTSVRGVQSEGYWTDATYPWDLLAATRRLLADGTNVFRSSNQRINGHQTETRTDAGVRRRRNGVWVAPGARVHENATLQAPVVVAADCEIGPGAVVGPNVAVGQNATVGPNAVVVDSIVDEDTRIGANSTVVDCVTGQAVWLGPSCVVTGGPADVRVDTQIHEGKRLGAVVGDRVHAEGDVSFAPGTLVGSNATLRTGTVVSGLLAPKSEVVR
ncbi:nucleotidyl transferase [Haloprofundus marisrubri]|uniref:Bifunctional protein GlmU n=1 Tax=Haloprofundus marisrubri TaxID=1514971 RepID=A0A0W1R6Q3_9EURY|nr:sugar phosphate nucleotidyltransferase [Haloprofundus marisrubri]KTG08959.1 nucleotidyl transferase [Haloprofundus marisrubri]